MKPLESRQISRSALRLVPVESPQSPLVRELDRCVATQSWLEGHRIAMELYRQGMAHWPQVSRFYWAIAKYQDARQDFKGSMASARLALAMDGELEHEISGHPRLRTILYYGLRSEDRPAA